MDLETQYTTLLEQLRSELVDIFLDIGPQQPDGEALDIVAVFTLLEQYQLDDKLCKYVMLLDATPKGLAEFSNQSPQNRILIADLLNDTELLKQMLLADGPRTPKTKGKGKDNHAGIGAQYGSAMDIHTKILSQSPQNAAQRGSIFQRLAIAIALEHSVPISQTNPKECLDCDQLQKQHVDPIHRYLHYETAYLNGELDPMFDTLSIFELRFVIDGDEPDSILTWGRKMLRNYRPDHILEKSGWDWRYVAIVKSNVRYGSQDVRHDSPKLQKYQNILMNGGVCGRRAFFGRFILRAFGIPTAARPSKGHGALCHYTPTKWVVNLGGGWGRGWTKTRYKKDLDFKATITARRQDPERAYWKVKRAQWIGDVMGERRVYGEHDNQEQIGFWYGMSLKVQRAILDEQKSDSKENDHNPNDKQMTIAEKLLQSPIVSESIACFDDGRISIPAALVTCIKKKKNDIQIMRSFVSGKQIYLPPFTPQGLMIMRGGTWKNDPNVCCSGSRVQSGGYGKYENWGFRVAVSIPHSDDIDGQDKSPMYWSLDLDGEGEKGQDGTPLELLYVQPGKFIMGGESTAENRFKCVEVPKHLVEITQGYYLGKFPITQAEYQAVMGKNPSKSSKHPNCPVDNIGVNDAIEFCNKLSEQTGEDVRLPTEAEWEYACRATNDSTKDTKWFFGDDPSKIGEYAWFKDNAGGKSHPVGQKKPNPWGFHDMYGNVFERISDKYAKDYYAKSPTIDPKGPKQGTKSNFQFAIHVGKSGKYALSANVVTVNSNQRLNVSIQQKGHPDNGKAIVIELPFTLGDWQDSRPVMLDLGAGEATFSFWRDKPPQYGIAIKEFMLVLV